MPASLVTSKDESATIASATGATPAADSIRQTALTGASKVPDKDFSPSL